jgi:hypothetical protein
MTTNPVNAQNRAFFTDLHDAFHGSSATTPTLPSC